MYIFLVFFNIRCVNHKLFAKLGFESRSSLPTIFSISVKAFFVILVHLNLTLVDHSFVRVSSSVARL